MGGGLCCNTDVVVSLYHSQGRHTVHVTITELWLGIRTVET